MIALGLDKSHLHLALNARNFHQCSLNLVLVELLLECLVEGLSRAHAGLGEDLAQPVRLRSVVASGNLGVDLHYCCSKVDIIDDIFVSL